MKEFATSNTGILDGIMYSARQPAPKRPHNNRKSTLGRRIQKITDSEGRVKFIHHKRY